MDDSKSAVAFIKTQKNKYYDACPMYISDIIISNKGGITEKDIQIITFDKREAVNLTLW